MKKKFPRVLALLMVLLALIVVAAGCAAPPGLPPSPGPPPSPSNLDNSDTELTRLIKRYLTYPGSSYGEIEILVGELPSDLPVDVPIPEDAEVIGSITTPRSGKYKSIQIMLDVPQEPDEITKFYRDCLTEEGWREEVKRPSAGGFVSPMVRSRVNFCYEGKILLNVYAYPTEEGKPTDVRLHVNNDPQTVAYAERPVRPGAGDVLPALLPPEGAMAPKGAIQMLGGGGGSGTGRQYSQATLETSLSIEELHTHYRAQLLEAGWKLKEEGGKGTVAWSTWSFADESDNDWVGLLLVRAPKEDCRILWLSADLVP